MYTAKGILFELHSCGNIQDLIPEIVDELKVDGLNIMKLNDIPRMKRITGTKVVLQCILRYSETGCDGKRRCTD